MSSLSNSDGVKVEQIELLNIPGFFCSRCGRKINHYGMGSKCKEIESNKRIERICREYVERESL